MSTEKYVKLPACCCKTDAAPVYEIPEGAQVCACDSETIIGTVIQFFAGPEDAMPSCSAKDVREDLEKRLGDDKKIVKVAEGKTNSGVKYVYDVLWRKYEDKDGIEYLLNMNLFFGEEALYVGAVMSKKGSAPADATKNAIKELVEFIIENN